MKKINEKFTLTITGELEELVYEEAISLLPEYQKRVFFEKYSKSDTNKNTYKAITEMGEGLLKEMHLNKNLFFYSNITCEYKNEFFVFDAVLNIFAQYCNFKCRDAFFEGTIDNNNYNSIIIDFRYTSDLPISIDYERTYLWFKKYKLDSVILSSVKQCKEIFI